MLKYHHSLITSFVLIIEGDTSEVCWWLGATKVEGNFQWNLFGVRFDLKYQLSDWDYDKPDNFGGKEDKLQTCRIRDANGVYYAWNDNTDNARAYFIRERVMLPNL